ncbi:MAG: 4-hydroxy-tetrahydrodipicolinate synthase [Synechococcaceae cyanobacterium SM2_3_2]|nr:4-hydroxy-tetrahydrodipicolinate synthase [Synechococcaceae cyanobacterium SM2_3_2]
MSSVNLGSVLTAMITPFNDAGGVDYGEAARLAAHLAENGSDGLVICGTTGESPTLTWQEEYELFQVVRDAVAGKATVIAGTGSNCTREAIEATRKAAGLGLDGSLQVVPYYNKPSQAGLYKHFSDIAAASDLPILLYNIPGRTGANLQPETVVQLAQLPTVVAIKEASGSMDAVSAIRQQAPSDFAIYAGDDSLTLPMLALGARGVVSVASHLVGSQIQAMIRAYRQGDTGLACKIHLELFPLFKALFIETNPVPVKAALALQGWSVGSVRTPLISMSSEQVRVVQDVMLQLSLLAPAVHQERESASVG